MSSTTIRIHPNEKLKLEKLQAKIFLLSGKKLSFPELLALLLRKNEDSIIQQILDELRTPKQVNWKTHLDHIVDMGFDNSDDIDKVLYG